MALVKFALGNKLAIKGKIAAQKLATQGVQTSSMACTRSYCLAGPGEPCRSEVGTSRAVMHGERALAHLNMSQLEPGQIRGPEPKGATTPASTTDPEDL